MYPILRRSLPLLLLAAALTSGCGSAGTTSSPTGTGRNSSILTSAEINEARLANLYDVVDRLRPRWLQVRSVSSLNSGPGQVVVFLNNKYLGTPEVLREFQPSSVTEIRYLDGPKAAATLQGYPDGAHVAGGIVLVTSPIGR